MATDRSGSNGASPETAAPRSASGPARPGILALLVGVALVVAAADQFAKAWAVGHLPQGVNDPNGKRSLLENVVWIGQR